jgi:nucleotide-binding universal stress UspA family protein
MKILLPVDGSAASMAAVQQALAWRRAGLQADYVLANVQEPPSLYDVVVVHDASVLDAVRAAVGADLLAPAEALIAAAGASCELEVAGGDPGHMLVDLIENYGCDAVVMGACGEGTSNSALGSVTLALLHHSPVPVLVVRAPQPEADDNA